MLKQASVSDLISERVIRGRKSYVVIAMCRYPRFVNRAYRDEYIPSLASNHKLLEDLLTAKRRSGNHNASFEKIHYEDRFHIDEEGMENLKRLTELSRKKDVYLVCQCAMGLRCHRELLLLLAKHSFKAKIDEVRNDYPHYMKRLKTEKPGIGIRVRSPLKKTVVSKPSTRRAISRTSPR